MQKDDNRTERQNVTVDNHTPGNWFYSRQGAQVYAKDPYGKGDLLVADVRGWGQLTGRGHGALKMKPEIASTILDANGRVMAAAPTMLKLLQRIVMMTQDKQIVSAINELLTEM